MKMVAVMLLVLLPASLLALTRQTGKLKINCYETKPGEIVTFHEKQLVGAK